MFDDYRAILTEALKSIKSGKNEIAKSAVLLEQFSSRLHKNTILLEQILKFKVQHHHYITKLLLLTDGLFFNLAVVLSECNVTSKKEKAL